MSARVFVVIVTYNGAKWVEPCFSSLRKSAIPLETIVIDNGSTDDTLARIEAGYPEVQIVRTGKNLGFGKANNVGMELAYQQGADYVFLLNQDAWIEPDAVERLVAVHRSYPSYGVISPMHMNGAGDALDYGFSNYIAPNKCQGLYSDIFFGKAGDIYDLSFVNAAAWLMSRECLEKVGGFSPSFFHYGEDDNYTHRLQYHRLKLGVAPGARISHDREQRPASKFFEDGEVFRRELVQRSSNPNQAISFSREAVSLYAHLALALLRNDSAAVKLQMRKLKLLSAMDKKTIAANRERSMQGNAAFLDLRSNTL
jgi:N-acetylglucosaminyl-diphospho-decaprenol L-rhamnosyltransferase